MAERGSKVTENWLRHSGTDDQRERVRVPFDFAQGRLSTALGVRRTSLRMTQFVMSGSRDESVGRCLRLSRDILGKDQTDFFLECSGAERLLQKSQALRVNSLLGEILSRVAGHVHDP